MKDQRGGALWEVVMILLLFPLVLACILAQAQALVELKKCDQRVLALATLESSSLDSDTTSAT